MPKILSNKAVADILTEMAALYEMNNVEFKPRAYERAALGVVSLEEPLASLYQRGGLKALEHIPGVGKIIAVHLEQIIKTGSFAEYRRLKKKTPVNLSELLAVEGIGPKTVKTLWEKLRVADLTDLEKAAKRGQVAGLPGFGEKSEQKILKGIEFLKKSGGRRLLYDVLPEAEALAETVKKLPGVKKAVVAGSLRRRKETIGDIDLLVISSKPAQTVEKFAALPQVAYVYGRGRSKINTRLRIGLDADLRIVPERSFGAALNYFTGSKDHNVALRELAIRRGWKLNEYGLSQGEKFIAGRSEREIYQKLGLAYIEPELRENRGEIEAARENRLPALIAVKDLRGDLQMHSHWSDGRSSIEQMAETAIKRGYEYIAITDHSRGLAMAGGLNETAVAKQGEEIEKLNAGFKSRGLEFRILKGVEVNILKNGDLDLSNDCLRRLEWVGASIHSHFDLPRPEQTQRLLRVLENPHVDILFHPSGRLINRRNGIDVDWEAVIRKARETGTFLEIDSFPHRLDLRDELIRQAVAGGVKMAIDSDAHSPGHLSFVAFGVEQARRGWTEKNDIVNTLPLQALLGLIDKK